MGNVAQRGTFPIDPQEPHVYTLEFEPRGNRLAALVDGQRLLSGETAMFDFTEPDGINFQLNGGSMVIDDIVLEAVSHLFDMNGDGEVNFGDLSPFVMGLTDIPAYEAAFTELADTRVVRGDVNEDGQFNFGDLTPFAERLTGGGTGGSAVPEPSTAIIAALVAIGSAALRRNRDAAV